jgi:hypothetical protein
VAGEISGIGVIPEEWGELPASSTLARELQWVQAYRLTIVRTAPTGGAVVDLAAAREPAPSLAALGWLETSIRNYNKYVELLARVTKDEQDEAGLAAREAHAIDEIDAIIRQMMRDFREQDE